MRPRRGATDLAGVLLVDKPAGLTSHDVVSALRTATGERRIGHSGTLDPMATGLLVVIIGRATRLERYLVGHDKSYDARIAFGKLTDTLDAEGTVTETAPVPPQVLDETFARDVLARFVGPQDQIPPAYSAIKRGGMSAHRVARAGGTPVLEPRSVEVYEASLRGINAKGPTWDVSFSVSKGTYIRSLARDIGEAAGTLAHLSGLRRTLAGTAAIDGALSLEAAVAAAEEGLLEDHLVDPVTLLGMPVVEVTLEDVRDGRSVAASDAAIAEDEAVAIVAADELLGVYRRRGNMLAPETVLSPGVPR
ncbi:MAG: tRNA pseudouridine(55) synthase TruB [Coriobacteriia bacterium]